MEDDFDEFSDVEELYSTLPLDEVEGLEDLVTAGPLVKVTFCCSISICLIFCLWKKKVLYLSGEKSTKFRNVFEAQVSL